MKKLLFLLVFAIGVLSADRTMTKEEYEHFQRNYILPTSQLIIYLVFYLFAVWLFTYPPDSFVDLGLTVENLFSGYLGRPTEDLVTYHCRRLVVNKGLVGIYTFIYFLILSIMVDNAVIFTFNPIRLLHIFANCSIAIALGSIGNMMFHNYTDFKYIRPRRFERLELAQWNQQIDLEIRSMETFTYRISSTSSLIITQTWIVYWSKFSFQVARVEEVDIHVTKAEELMVNPLNPEGAVQILTVKIALPTTCGQDIYVKMHNLTLQYLRSTVTANILIPSDIVFKLSTLDKFAEIFASEAAKNDAYYVDADAEFDLCLACAEIPANMKIIKNCNPREGEVPCGTCNCRPMWCVLCMAKVFAAKQNQEQPGTWIIGKCPCPTCRATFCILDVAMLKRRET